MVYLEDTVGRNVMFQCNKHSGVFKSRSSKSKDPILSPVPDAFDAGAHPETLRGGCWFSFRNRKISTIVKAIFEVFINDVSTVLKVRRTNSVPARNKVHVVRMRASNEATFDDMNNCLCILTSYPI